MVKRAKERQADREDGTEKKKNVQAVKEGRTLRVAREKRREQ